MSPSRYIITAPRGSPRVRANRSCSITQPREMALRLLEIEGSLLLRDHQRKRFLSRTGRRAHVLRPLRGRRATRGHDPRRPCSSFPTRRVPHSPMRYRETPYLTASYPIHASTATATATTNRRAALHLNPRRTSCRNAAVAIRGSRGSSCIRCIRRSTSRRYEVEVGSTPRPRSGVHDCYSARSRAWYGIILLHHVNHGGRELREDLGVALPVPACAVDGPRSASSSSTDKTHEAAFGTQRLGLLMELKNHQRP